MCILVICISSFETCLLAFCSFFKIFFDIQFYDLILILLIVLNFFCRYFLISFFFCSPVIWWLSLVLCLDFFSFYVCISYRFLVCDYHGVFIKQFIYIYVIISSCLCPTFNCLLTPCICTLPSWLLFLVYFISSCFVYSLTAYRGYRWFYFFCVFF